MKHPPIWSLQRPVPVSIAMAYHLCKFGTEPQVLYPCRHALYVREKSAYPLIDLPERMKGNPSPLHAYYLPEEDPQA